MNLDARLPMLAPIARRIARYLPRPRLPSRRTWWRFGRALVLLAVGVLSLIALVYSAINWQGRRDWKKAIEQAKVEGWATDLAELWPAPAPDQDNFSKHPFIRDMFDGYWKTVAERRLVEWGQTESPFALPFTVPKQNLDGSSMYADRADQTLNQWRAVLAGGDLAEVVGRYDGALDQLADAAARPRNVAIPAPMQIENLGRAFGFELRPAYRLLHVRGLLRLEKGDQAGAAADATTLLRLSRHMRETPLVGAQINANQIAVHGLSVVRAGLERHSWSDAQLVGLSRELMASDGFDALVRCHAFEAMVETLRYRYLAESPRRIHELFLGERYHDPMSIGFRLFPAALWPGGPSDYIQGWPRSGEEANTQIIRALFDWLPRGPNQVLEWLPSGYWLSNAAESVEQIAAVRAQVLDFEKRCLRPEAAGMNPVDAGPWRMVFIDYSPTAARSALVHLAFSGLRGQVELDLARMAVALERWQMARGGYPESLTELKTVLGVDVPLDAMDGQALRYQRLPERGYLLYSVGGNQTDEGGARHPDARLDRGNGDWVW